MTENDYATFCIKEYSQIFGKTYASSKIENDQDREREAQKTAIREATLTAFKQYPSVEAADIWKAVYSAHLRRKSGLDIPAETVTRVVAAENSWKKASGHAFEEIVKRLSNAAFNSEPIKVYLQKELAGMVTRGEVHNEVRDISWLKEQMKASSFDLYICVSKGDKRYVYGCMQTKTSIRDRVTRDREPSENAMSAFFWSVAIVLDGDFLKLPKFVEMVNGGGSSYSDNGWHGLYVMSDKYTKDRIYPVNADLTLFTLHARKAAEDWLTQRQWINKNWRPEKVA